MNISPVIHHLHPELDTRQQQVAGHTSGPLLVVSDRGRARATASSEGRSTCCCLGRRTLMNWCSAPSAGTRP